ncbi:peptidyl-prolyl cis-trans isomerase FKBP20-2, chloroplastic isoform X2 [Macadamia integrifolia]|uniref:peptidyl-prolyl cis-trans isomerase FKBP20-2, chloroplastic isoform X2 n=1 Tax=Macadamia integrifolia TaxID=60698 RepID=UPI001C4F28C6|nr:peptidyl-prolyl cis-trans isomerase FKBP20-2, chloroplastic isoform X2 [Macadamia integrifolia]
MQLISTTSLSSFPCRTPSLEPTLRSFCFQKKQTLLCCFTRNHSDDKLWTSREFSGYTLFSAENLRRRYVLFFLVSSGLFPTSASGKTKSKSGYDEKRLLEQNRRMQEANNVPPDFPNFVREGFQVKVVASDNYVKCDSGLIYSDIEVGKGRRIDSTYFRGSPAKIRMGTNALVPGFEEGIKEMKPGGKRRIIIPPELGPPVGPSTFFSSKQFEVFDVELLDVQDCQRRTIGFYSDVVCN